jgi:hypothetical protein
MAAATKTTPQVLDRLHAKLPDPALLDAIRKRIRLGPMATASSQPAPTPPAAPGTPAAPSVPPMGAGSLAPTGGSGAPVPPQGPRISINLRGDLSPRTAEQLAGSAGSGGPMSMAGGSPTGGPASNPLVMLAHAPPEVQAAALQHLKALIGRGQVGPR